MASSICGAPPSGARRVWFEEPGTDGASLASRIVFDDVVTPKMWAGMLLVVLGVTLVAQGAPR